MKVFYVIGDPRKGDTVTATVRVDEGLGAAQAAKFLHAGDTISLMPSEVDAFFRDYDPNEQSWDRGTFETQTVLTRHHPQEPIMQVFLLPRLNRKGAHAVTPERSTELA